MKFDENKHYRDNKGRFAKNAYRQNTEYDEILKDTRYAKRLDSAAMNKYSTVRQQVKKNGFAYTYVNDGIKSYYIKIKKSEDDFEYDVIKEW